MHVGSERKPLVLLSTAFLFSFLRSSRTLGGVSGVSSDVSVGVRPALRRLGWRKGRKL